MSYAMGHKIKELRTSRKISQEHMADYLGMTRQRYSRLENGQVDLSYVTIRKIADHFGVSVKEITCAEQEERDFVAYFRENTGEDVACSVEKIEKILRVFHAHEKLYDQMKEHN